MTVLKLGWTNPQTDVFGAHPLLGPVLDLNDGQLLTLVAPDGLDLPPPARTLVTTGNVRAQGERATRAIYRHNRRVTLQLIVGPSATYAALVASIHTLVAWLNSAPAVPIVLQYQSFGATTPLYLDIVGAAHDIPEDEGQWLRLQLEPMEIVLLARPGLRGNRVTLHNLAINPGFEAPSGPGVGVFADSFASTVAYTTQAGAASSLALPQYKAIVLGDTPLRYYRLDEASGTLATDSSANAQHGTYSATGVTYGQAGALAAAGDADTAALFNGSAGDISVPITGLPAGNGAVTLEAWVKLAALPAATVYVAFLGTLATRQALQLRINASGAVEFDLYGVITVVSAPLSVNTFHHLVGTYDGTTMRLYIDGGAPTTTVPAGGVAVTYGTAWLAAQQGPAGFFPGTIDEVGIYGAALSATQVSNHYAAATTSSARTLAVAAGTRLACGSAQWSAVNAWQLRFLHETGIGYSLYLHYVDSSNNLYLNVAGTTMTLNHLIAGVNHVQATLTLALTNGSWYWWRITQFPSVVNDAPGLTAALYADSAGTVGALVGNVGPTGAYDAATALVGQPQIACNAGTLVLGGNYAGAHSVALFGPGGWQFNGNGGTAPAYGMWEQDPTRCFANGPVPSWGAARIDVAAAGTVDANWRLFAGGAGAAGSSAAPVKAAGNRLSVAAYTKSMGLGSTAQTQLIVSEYDAAGGLLRATTVATLTGSQAAWPPANSPNLAGAVVTGAGCAYVDVQLRLVDAVAGASANGTVWFDNVQVWNQTTTGQATMPYCETRFPQAPATVLLTGLLGDLPAPAALAIGTYLAAGAWGPGSTLRLVLGRRGQSVGANAAPMGPASGVGGSGGQLVGAPVAFTGAYYGTGANIQAQALLDATAYGGYVTQVLLDSGGWNPRALSPRASDLPGVYHLYHRFRSSQALGNLANVQVRPLVGQVRSPWYGLLDGSDVVGQYYGPYSQPLLANGASNLWTVVDVGQIALPPFPAGALADPTQTFVVPRANWYDSTGGATAQSGWQAFMPVDGSLLVGLVNYAANAGAQIGPVNQWLWVYGDGLLANRAGAGDMLASWTYSIEAAALPNAGRGAGGPGTQATGSINVNVGADPYLLLDPTLTVAGGATFGGINQIVSVLADGAGSVAALDIEVAYSPLYIYPN